MLENEWNEALATLAANPTDEQAFRRVWGSVQPRIRGLLVKRVPVGQVDDLAQEIGLRVFKGLSSYRVQLPAEQHFVAWVFKIANNVITDFFRRHARRPEDFTANGQVPDLESFPEQTRDPILAQAIREYTALLSLADQSLLLELQSQTLTAAQRQKKKRLVDQLRVRLARRFPELLANHAGTPSRSTDRTDSAAQLPIVRVPAGAEPHNDNDQTCASPDGVAIPEVHHAK